MRQDKVAFNDIVIWHVGGSGDCGPVEKILCSPFRDKVKLIIFEPREASNDAKYIQELSLRGIKGLLVNTCVLDKVGKQTLYINKHPQSSSLLRPAQKAKLEHIPWGDWLTWAEDTALDRTVTVETTTIDRLVQGNNLPLPDVVSIDAQGSELPVLLGGAQSISKNTLCVVSEVEFFEIYEGQGLFQDQYQFLYKLDFRLADILNQQYWHPSFRLGEGFLSVGEALFLRNPGTWGDYASYDDERKVISLLKLAVISYCFERYSNVYRIIETIKKQFADASKVILSATADYNKLIEVYNFINQNMDKYKTDKFYLQNKPDYSILSRKPFRRNQFKWITKQILPPFALGVIRKLRNKLKDGKQ
ncbi:MAG: FkbM family methyltransferase [Candidatus Omnitrophica bacterium]|jgi:FkbM family methyltransferase|nr:FkbM family methyltransferase [Candidatus Omnitrophota bacterium]